MSVNFNDKNISQIAKELGCSRYKAKQAIVDIIKLNGKPIYLNTHSGISGQHIDTILQMRTDNIRVVDIAKYYKVTRDCIYKILKKWG